MRLLHPKTLEIASRRDDIPKTVISHVWSEIFKWLGSNKKKHPKVFIDNDYHLGGYLSIVFDRGKEKGCNFDENKINNLGEKIRIGYHGNNWIDIDRRANYDIASYFNDNYLFSDACSLYYKGINIFPDIFGDEWRKYVPVESHKEIKRQIDKTLNK